MIGGRWAVLSNDDDFGVTDSSPASTSYVAKTIPNSSPTTTDYNQLLVVDLARGATATGTVTVEQSSYRRVRRLLWVEAALLSLIPLFAAFAARGIG